MEWQGDNPYYLMIAVNGESRGLLIDLDQRGWSTEYAAYMRATGYWYLINKATDHITFKLVVLDGEQPYYTRRVIGITGSGGSNDVAYYGIGKKRVDGHIDRLWIAADGVVCAGDDVDLFGVEDIKRLGPRPIQEEAVVHG